MGSLVPRPKRSLLLWVSAFLTGLAAASWYAGALELVSVPGRRLAMQVSTGAGLLLTGLAIVAQILRRKRLAFAFGVAAAGLGSMVLAEQVLSRPFAYLDLLFLRGPDGLAMSPVTVLALVLLAALVLVLCAPGVRKAWRVDAAGVLASLLVACGAAGLVGGTAPEVPAFLDLRTAVAFVALGMAFFLLVVRLRSGVVQRPIPTWMPWAAGLGVGVMVVGLWAGLTTLEERWRRETTSRLRFGSLTHTAHGLADHGLMLERLARLVARPGADGDLLDVFLQDVPAVDGVWLVDGDDRARLAWTAATRDGQGAADGSDGGRHGGAAQDAPVGDARGSDAADAPDTLSAPDLAAELLAHAHVGQALARSRREGTSTSSLPVAVEDGSRRLVLCLPLGDRHEGADDPRRLVVSHLPSRLLATTLPAEVQRLADITISDGSSVVWRNGPPGDGPAQASDAFEGRLPFGDRLWTLSAVVRPTAMTINRGASNALVLWIGVFLAVAIAIAVRKSEQVRQRARSLEQAAGTIEEHAESLARANDELRDQAEHLKATEEQLRRAAQERRRVLDALSAFLIGVDGHGQVTEWNQVSSELFGVRAGEALERPFDQLALPWDREAVGDAVRECLASGRRVLRDAFAVAQQDGSRIVSFTVNPTQHEGRRGFVIIGADVTERQMLESQLHAARKLESVGTLSAGIAHEINTPMQFVGDNVRFVAQSMGPAIALLELAPALLEGARRGELDDEAARRVEQLLDGVDAEFVTAEVPLALDETLEGIERVTTIVRAMKDFSHPGGDGHELADLNQAIETTLAVARNEYKYIADVQTDLADLPRVECWVGDLNQVFLNLLVNGTHAIRDRLGDSGRRGTLTVSSRLDGDHVELRFGDSGGGIPEDVRGQIFDQFFTTKEIGVGTGLGLSIARAVVVDKHGGTIDFETETGVGTTFIVRLPVTLARNTEVEHGAPAVRG